jgi:hypothetical protein
VNQRLQPKPEDPQMLAQYKMMTFMMVFFGFIFYQFPAGFMLYILSLGMNPLKRDASTRTKDDIETIRHLYVDLDHDGSAALERIKNSEKLNGRRPWQPAEQTFVGSFTEEDNERVKRRNNARRAAATLNRHASHHAATVARTCGLVAKPSVFGAMARGGVATLARERRLVNADDARGCAAWHERRRRP